MRYKSIKIPSVTEEVVVSEDGKKIIYKDKEVHFSLVKSKNHSIGYYQISIEGKRMYAHRVIAEAFVPKKHPLTHKYIIHIDANTLNNDPINLEWADWKKVINHRKKNNAALPESYRGSSKISHEEVLKIVERLKQGEFAKDICKEYNVSEMSIARIRKRYIGEAASIRFPKNVKEITLKLLKKHKASELASITGISYHTLYRWSKELTKK